MAGIKNMEGMTDAEIDKELDNGAKFVVFQYCFSVIIMTFKRGSDVYFIKAGESAVGHSLKYSLITLLFGWWGIPWGPIYSIGSFYTNFSGGKDVTQAVLQSIHAAQQQKPTSGPPTA